MPPCPPSGVWPDRTRLRLWDICETEGQEQRRRQAKRWGNINQEVIHIGGVRDWRRAQDSGRLEPEVGSCRGCKPAGCSGTVGAGLELWVEGNSRDGWTAPLQVSTLCAILVSEEGVVDHRGIIPFIYSLIDCIYTTRKCLAVLSGCFGSWEWRDYLQG